MSNVSIFAPRKRASGMAWGYGKTIAERVRKKHNTYCTEAMVYKVVQGKNSNLHIRLEIELHRAEMSKIKKELQQIAGAL